jgi:hypothetical protein
MARCKKTDMLMGAIKKAGGGKVQTSSDTARKLATEMGGMKKGGAAKMPREGVSSRPTTPSGRPLTMKDLEKANRDTGGMSAAEIKKAGEAIGRGNRTPYEPIPKKKGGMAKGGAGKVRKGMMSPSGNILQAVKPKKGIGGIM